RLCQTSSSRVRDPSQVPPRARQGRGSVVTLGSSETGAARDWPDDLARQAGEPGEAGRRTEVSGLGGGVIWRLEAYLAERSMAPPAAESSAATDAPRQEGRRRPPRSPGPGPFQNRAVSWWAPPSNREMGPTTEWGR